MCWNLSLQLSPRHGIYCCTLCLSTAAIRSLLWYYYHCPHGNENLAQSFSGFFISASNKSRALTWIEPAKPLIMSAPSQPYVKCCIGPDCCKIFLQLKTFFTPPFPFMLLTQPWKWVQHWLSYCFSHSGLEKAHIKYTSQFQHVKTSCNLVAQFL